MVLLPVHCPYCQSDRVVKRGRSESGEQRYLCQNEACAHRSFRLDYVYKGRLPQIRQQIIEMALNGSGIRDTARVLEISTSTVLKELKKKESALESVNSALLERLPAEQIEVELLRVEEAEVDEMWSFVGKKTNPRWLWHAIDHRSGQVLAYVLGTHQDTVFLKLKRLLEPFGITHFYTDDWGTYQRHLDSKRHHIGKQHTQKIERKHLTLRTRIKRLARKTICFSKTRQMHDIVIGLFINRYEFGVQV
ncbi:IS1 family transposase [Nitrosococcus oceani]|uniref:IS1 family transposase n=2 Tax=Nitrosococcus TaxID=1227 RepID=UPI0004E8C7F4|nr:IS1 family transposase [Nitrosococcus oceani]KFI21249.1 transposase [Nitrosococcus oceani]